MAAEALTTSAGLPEPLGVSLRADGANVAVVSENATGISVSVFDDTGDKEIARLALPTREGNVFCGFVGGMRPGMRYGLRADGPFDPQRGHRFDPAKLLVDPYALALDRPFVFRTELSAPRSAGIDTAPFVPKAIVSPPRMGGIGTRREPGRSLGVVYEVAVKAFTRRHPEIPRRLRGTFAGLAAPRVIEYLTRLGIDTVELMPVAAWIDERHLPVVGLVNAWGYNPVVFMAPDPRLAPGGLEDVSTAVAALHSAGINVVLDVVYNHTGESDELGATLSLRGLDNALYYRHDAEGRLINDTGTGNTLAIEREPVLRLVLDAMHHWAEATAIDGFRLDLAATLARLPAGFTTDSPFCRAVESDPLLSRLHFIAEPWDIGPGGYQLGRFPARWHEWNDRYRDDVRRFWRGDPETLGALATRLAGSADFFAGRRPSSSINFVAAHDGFTVADLVAYERKHNLGNGEENRDGTEANFSWNNGEEGPSADPAIEAARQRDIRALLATLLVSRGTPMLTAGDEFRRSQVGNNNAYAQDNEVTWLDWEGADTALAAFAARLIGLRKAHRSLSLDRFLTGAPIDQSGDRRRGLAAPDRPRDDVWGLGRSAGAGHRLLRAGNRERARRPYGHLDQRQRRLDDRDPAGGARRICLAPCRGQLRDQRYRYDDRRPRGDARAAAAVGTGLHRDRLKPVVIEPTAPTLVGWAEPRGARRAHRRRSGGHASLRPSHSGS